MSGLVPVIIVMQLWVRVDAQAYGRLHFGDALEEVAELLAQHGGVFVGERLDVGEGAVLRARAGANEDQVFADVVEPFVELLTCAPGRGHHGDDRAGADDDAEAGEHRPPLVNQQGGEGHAEGGQNTHELWLRLAPVRRTGPGRIPLPGSANRR